MKAFTLVLIAALFALQDARVQPDGKISTPYRADSSAYIVMGKDTRVYVTENRSFRYEDVLGDAGNYEAVLLLEQTYHNERADGRDGVQGNAAVRAWTVNQNGEREIRWTFKQIGNEGEVHGRFFRVTAWGCCDVPVVYSYYNLLTGKKLYVSNSDLLEVWGDGDGPQAWRYVGFGYAGIRDLDRPPELQHGTDKRVTQRFSLLSSRQYYDAPQVFLSSENEVKKSLDLRGSAMHFTIVLKYQDGVELRVPAEGDTIRADKAQLPKGYSLRPEE